MKKPTLKLAWQITYAHMIAYFLAGLFALLAVNYRDLYATASLSLLMRPIDDPVVALGPALQVARGLVLALAIIPLRRAFFEDDRGYLKLGLAVLAFSLLSTIGPTPGSLDGYIYTTIPAGYQLLGYPEALLYTALFVGILKLAHKFDGKKLVLVLPILLVCLILLMSAAGYFMA